MYIKRSLIYLLLLLPNYLSAEGYFTWSPNLQLAYNRVLELRFEEANNLIAHEKQNNPSNLMSHHVENYIDFFQVYINEEKAEFERLEPNKNKRLEKIKNGDADSPYYLYLQATTRLHWALARLKFKEYATAAFEVNKAFKLLTKNAEKFPDFVPNKKELGILHAAVGTIPNNYRWMVELLSSLEGTFDQGKRELEEVINYAQRNRFIYEEEIYVLYSYLLLHLGNDMDGSWNIIQQGNLSPSTSLMGTFITANIAMRTGRNDEAIRILQNRPSGDKYHNFHYLDYLLGLAKLQRLDRDADGYLLRYLNSFMGQNFIKDAYQKLSWHALLFKDDEQYLFYKNQCIKKGNTIVGSDKSALKEAEANERPNAVLLKSRLLFDGGYYQKAYDLLKSKSVSEFNTERFKLEYYYRKGRMLHALERYEEALDLYQKTIDNGRNASWYFACRAALEQGKIHEKNKNITAAQKAFQLCLDIKPDEHKTGLHHQAKAGLRRLE